MNHDMLTPVTDANETRALFDKLKARWSSGAKVYPNMSIGFQGGGHRANMFWRQDVGIWGVFEPDVVSNRFWICWGTDQPSGSFNIIVETNPPKTDFDRRCSGAFLRAGNRILLGHSGRVGGGRKGIGKQAFKDFTQSDNWHDVLWPDRKISNYLIIGDVAGESL